LNWSGVILRLALRKIPLYFCKGKEGKRRLGYPGKAGEGSRAETMERVKILLTSRRG
jgi:hypothetical protein